MPSTSLPSVLDPKMMHVPEMSYQQAIDVIDKTISSIDLAVNEKLPNRPVSVVLYDPVGSSLTVDEGMLLVPHLTLISIVIDLQKRLDDCNLRENREKMLVKVVEIRIGTKDVTKGYPGINGQVMFNSKWCLHKSKDELEKEKGKVGEWILWKTGGSEMERYWAVYRDMLLLGGDNKVGKPILKVRTVKRVGETGKNSCMGGHLFDDGRQMKSLRQFKAKTEEQGTIDATYELEHRVDAGGAWLNTAPAWEGRAAPYQHNIGQKFENVLQRYHAANMLLKAAESTPAPIPEPKTVVNPKRTWGYYQRMGGDPRIHKLISLDHLPFELKDFLKIDIPRDPTFVPGICESRPEPDLPKPDDGISDSDSDTITPANISRVVPSKATGRDPPTSQCVHMDGIEIRMVPYNPLPWPLTSIPSPIPPPSPLIKPEKIERGIRDKEGAINFDSDDDDIFFHGLENKKRQVPATVPSPTKKPQKFRPRQPSRLVNTERGVQTHIDNIVARSPLAGMFNTEPFKKFVSNANKGKSPEHQRYASVTNRMSTAPFQSGRNSIVDAGISGGDSRFIQNTNIVTTLSADSPAFTFGSLMNSSITNQSPQTLQQRPAPTLSADSPAFRFGSPMMFSGVTNQGPRVFPQHPAPPPQNEPFPPFDFNFNFNFNGGESTYNSGGNFNLHTRGSTHGDGNM
jgi:hypothetical protein